MATNLVSSSILILFLFIIITVHSKQISYSNLFTTKLESLKYKRLSKYCHIENYQEWLQQQREFMIWLDLAKLLQLPIHNDEEFQREFEQFRLQYQCLRLVERLPISVGPG